MSTAEKAPTVEQEMAKFSGFTTNNGQTVKAADTAKGPGDDNLSDEERAAGHTVAGEEAARGATKDTKTDEKPAAKVTLTKEESDAALTAARAALKLADDEELSKDEEDEALLSALNEKNTAAKAGGDPRVKRAQEGRRRAEARAARAEQALSSLERRLAAIENGGGKAPLTTDKDKGKDGALKEPDPKDFEFGEVDAKYIRALARYELQQAKAEDAHTQQTQTLTAAQQREQAEFTAKREAFEDAGHEQFDDFQEVVLDTVGLPKSDPAAWPLSATLRDLLFESDEGPAIIYQLASDPKEARRVDKLSPAAQAVWFGRQAAKISAEQAAGQGEKDKTEERGAERRQSQDTSGTRHVSKAPPPLDRGRGAGGNKQPSAATTDFAAFEAMANQPARR